MAKLDIRLAETNEDYFFINELFYNEPGIKEIFYGKQSRVICAYHVFIITLDEKNIGFIYTTNEQIDKFGFLDIGIMKKYRGHGYSKLATLKLLKYYLENYPNVRFYIIAETKNYNTAANKSIDEIGKFLFSVDDINYYLANEEIYEDLMETGNYDILFDHCTNPKNDRETLREIMEDDTKKKRK